MASYDPQIIQTFADRLYSQARTIAFVYGLVGAGAGAIGGDFAGNSTAMGVGALLGLLLGVVVGIQAGFRLKLQAQTALCQLAIEQNTRHAG